MKGFDPKFRDFPDYIIGITKEIWEDRGIATLHRYYGEDVVVRTPAGLTIGNEGVIAATLATLAEFPDRTLLGQDVIWSGTPEEGMLSSHRLLSTATHAGDGAYGRASGTRLRYRILADCYAIDNVITDEWLIRDQGAIVRQLGRTPEDYARDQIAREGGPERCARPLTPGTDRPGPYAGRGNDDIWGARLAEAIGRLMQADLAAIPQLWDRACELAYPGGIEGQSWGDADRFWTRLRAAFPDAAYEVHHVIGRDDPMMPPRAAVRWSLTGTHSGWGAFGAPSGAEVHVMGITQAEFGPFTERHLGADHSIRREWTLYDETQIWKQILLHTGAHD